MRVGKPKMPSVRLSVSKILKIYTTPITKRKMSTTQIFEVIQTFEAKLISVDRVGFKSQRAAKKLDD